MSTLRELAAELEYVSAANRADWALARAAACPWYAPLRRVILLRRARVHERAMATWQRTIYAACIDEGRGQAAP